MKEKEIRTIARWINQVIENHADEKMLKAIHKDVIVLCKKFPLYKDLNW
jgi:glycine hydroxymethyltransferase